MENCGVEDLLSAFASDAFNVQSQSEKDLRTSLITFFSAGHDGNHLNHRSRAINLHLPPLGLSSQSPHSAGHSLGGMSPIYHDDKLPPPNTPLGSPMKEDFFAFPVAPQECFGSGHSQDSSPSPASHVFQSARNHDGSSALDQYGDCNGCLHSVTFPQAPHHSFLHHQACHLNQCPTNEHIVHNNSNPMQKYV